MHFSPIISISQDLALSAQYVGESLQRWHKRFGHVCHSTVKKMHSSKIVDVLRICNPVEDSFFCEGCVFGKHHRLPFPTDGRTRAFKRGQIIHTDLCGPMPNPSPTGSRYFLTFRDDFTGYGFIRFLKKKSDSNLHLKDLMQAFDNESGSLIITLRSDNGGEFVNNDLQTWIKNKGIQHKTSAPKTPEQNGVAERFNRTILESCKSMLHSSSLALNLWAEAAATAVYVLNRVSSRASLLMTPYKG